MFRFSHALALAAFTLTSSSAFAVGTIVAAGGGSEGDQGDTSSWSYRLYKKLVQNGDANHDGQIKVVILSTAAADAFLPNYFLWLGATQALNVKVASLADANNSSIVGTVASADVVFLKGGDQGQYYDLWNNTLLEQNIRTVVQTNNGAIGGTSAGAMSLAQYCFSGGQDLVSLDVLQDAQTAYLNDASSGGTGIHTDFLGFVSAVIDTHYTTRARLGRMLGIMGKAVQDNNNMTLLSIGIEERTGIAITGTTAEVVGIGSVDFLQQTSSTVLRRDAKRPLYYTNLRVDRLTEGWKFNLSTRLPDTASRPSGAVAVTYPGDGSSNSGALTIKGTSSSDENKFARTVDYSPDPYSTGTGSASTYVRNTLGLTNAQNSTPDDNGIAYRGDIQESMWRAIYDYPSYTGFLVASSGQLTRGSTSTDLISFAKNTSQSSAEAATLVLDCKTCTYKSLSPYTSNEDTGGNTLKAAGVINARVQVLGESVSRGAKYNTKTHTVTGGPTP